MSRWPWGNRAPATVKSVTNVTGAIGRAIPDSKDHGGNMGRQDPGGPHVGPMNFAIWDDEGFKDH